MKYLSPILYGIIIAHWLMSVRDRLVATNHAGRYAVVGMHSGRDEYILVAKTADQVAALNATDFLEENSVSYIGLCYELLIPEDRAEFETIRFTDGIEQDDREVVETTRGLCGP